MAQNPQRFADNPGAHCTTNHPPILRLVISDSIHMLKKMTSTFGQAPTMSEKMTFDQFISSLDAKRPPRGLPETLSALWWDGKGDWDTAHSIAQQIPTVQGSAVHAYLHRKEGVLWNADYWYSRAGRRRPEISLVEEWRLLVSEMLGVDGD
jgi:hypothetical protein